MNVKNPYHIFIEILYHAKFGLDRATFGSCNGQKFWNFPLMCHDQT